MQLPPTIGQHFMSTKDVQVCLMVCCGYLVGRLGEGQGLAGGQGLVGLAVVWLHGDARDELRQRRPTRVRARQRLHPCAQCLVPLGTFSETHAPDYKCMKGC